MYLLLLATTTALSATFCRVRKMESTRSPSDRMRLPSVLAEARVLEPGIFVRDRDTPIRLEYNATAPSAASDFG